jgi:proteasome lid subunit RPN8/RPN11
MATEIRIPIWRWTQLVLQLRRRGGGCRESGAFLLARPDSKRVLKFICYDDLDPHALDTGIITFHGMGFVPLWDYCRDHKLKVVADVHTHGGDWTGQSDSDRTHPMIGLRGHISLIVPHFAQRNLVSMVGVGVFEYEGNHEWRECCDSTVRLTIL